MSTLYSNPLGNAYSWIDQEYKDFRTYPRVTKAESLLKAGETKEAKYLLHKALKIDNKNKNAIAILLKICIQEEDNLCIQKYSKEIKGVGLGYFYKKKSEKAKENKDYVSSITSAKKSLKHTLTDDDRYFVTLILFESYLKLKQYALADTLINKTNISMYQLFKWSKVSNNIKETNYAYSLAKELPNKVKYIKWKIKLLLKNKQHTEASRQIELLNKIEPTIENKKQLLHLYALTNQDKNIVQSHQKKLQEGCNKYALEFLLDYYKNNKNKKIALLEKNYPYDCLAKKQQIKLSLQLIQYLKIRKPKLAKKISKSISKKITRQKDLINLYQNSGQKNKLAKLYQKKLNQKCDNYSLYFLLDHYKNNKKMQKNILNNAYPYSCLDSKEQTKLSLELITFLEKDDLDKTKVILKNLNIKTIKTEDFLYLSNLESSMGNYKNSIRYASHYLKKYPNNKIALQNIGYSYFKLNNKNSAIHYLMKVSKLNPTDHQLLKNIGYLCIDLKRYKTATYYWNLYLDQKEDNEIQLELASLYYQKLKQKKIANTILKQYELSSKKYTSNYYLLKAKLSHNTKNCKGTLKYYEKALKIQKNEQTRYEYIHLLQRCKEESKALNLMQQFTNDYPDNIRYNKELAYMYNNNKNYTEAIKQFQNIKDKEPKQVKNYLALAYAHKNLDQNEQAIDLFQEAIDKSQDMSTKQKQHIKREITNLSKPFHFYLLQTARLNSYQQRDNLSPVNNASYNGFGSVQLSYQPHFLVKEITLYANLIHGHKKVKKTLQPSVGIRYKPMKDKEIYLSAEQLIKGGKSSRNDTLLRTSLGITGTPKATKHENLFLEGAYFTKSDATILYGNYELGKVYKTSKNIDVIPYITTGATYSNDNSVKKSVTKLDIGIGITANILSDENHYEVGKYKNTLKLEARQQYAGNSKDKQTLRVQWEFFY